MKILANVVNIKLILLFATLLILMQFNSYAQNNSKLLELEKVDEKTYTVKLLNVDGSIAQGQLKLPNVKKASYPILLSLHGMGRSHHRLWGAEYKRGKTIENTHLLTQIALAKGFAVLGIDARYHGGRKVEGLGLRKILGEMKEGNTDNYENMINNTVSDYLLLIEQLKDVSFLDSSNISLVGYSMGAQQSLLIAAKSPEVSRVFSLVAPAISEGIETVSPLHQVKNIKKAQVYLFTSNEDQYSSSSENTDLFNAISSPHKLRIEFNGDHVLPKNYVRVFEQLWAL